MSVNPQAARTYLDAEEARDAQRADVYAAILLASEKQATSDTKVITAFQEHTNRFSTSREKVEHAVLPLELRQEVASQHDSLAAFLRTTRELYGLAFSNHGATFTRLTEFEQINRHIEEGMNRVHDVFAENSERSTAAAQMTEGFAAATVIMVAVMRSFFISAIGSAVARRLVTTIGRSGWPISSRKAVSQ